MIVWASAGRVLTGRARAPERHAGDAGVHGNERGRHRSTRKASSCCPAGPAG